MKRVWLVMMLVALSWVAASVASANPIVERGSATGDGDTDTITDELESQRDEFDIIAGRVDIHGPEWAQQRAGAATTTREMLDLTYILARFGDVDAARGLMERVGRATEAADWRRMARAATALAIAEDSVQAGLPDDLRSMHQLAREDGASDGDLAWFRLLRQWIDWRVDAVDGEAGTPMSVDGATGYDALKQLLTDFPDAAEPMRAFGDALRDRGHLHLAVYAWLRARQLGHPDDDAIQQRIDEVWAEWKQAAAASDEVRLEDREQAMREMNAELLAGHEWLRMLHKYEAIRLERGAPVDDFADTIEELRLVKVEKRWPRERGLRSTDTQTIGNVILFIGWSLGSLMVLAIIIVTVRRGGRADPPGIHTAVSE